MATSAFAHYTVREHLYSDRIVSNQTEPSEVGFFFFPRGRRPCCISNGVVKAVLFVNHNFEHYFDNQLKQYTVSTLL
jgi:hypothetical protein